MTAADGSAMVRELTTDYLWKIGIVLVLAVVAVTVMVRIWRRAGRPDRDGERDAEGR